MSDDLVRELRDGCECIPEQRLRCPAEEACREANAAADRIEELEAENARLREAQGWQPIDTAPKDGTEICAWVGSGYKGGWLQLSWYKVNGLAAWRDWDQDTWEPTHWMLPLEPPKSSNFSEKVQLDDAK